MSKKEWSTNADRNVGIDFLLHGINTKLSCTLSVAEETKEQLDKNNSQIHSENRKRFVLPPANTAPPSNFS